MNKITKIEVCKRNKERVNIYINEDFAFAMEAELVYKYNLKVDKEIDVDKLSVIAKEEEFSKCKNSALKTIERSYKTESEIKKKLLEKEYSEEVVFKTIDFLKEYNFIDDYTFVKMYIKDRIINQGKNKIKYSLVTKGVDKTLIEEAFLELDTREDEEEKAFILGKKKYDSLSKRESDKLKLKNKVIRYLIGRGYDYSISKDVYSKITSDDFY